MTSESITTTIPKSQRRPEPALCAQLKDEDDEKQRKPQCHDKPPVVMCVSTDWTLEGWGMFRNF